MTGYPVPGTMPAGPGVTAEEAPQEPGGARLGTRPGRAALLRAATLGLALTAGRVSAATSPVLQFIRHDIDSGVFGQVTQGLGVGDIDGDGRPDIVVGGDSYLVWFHNPDWAPNLIASGFKFAGGAEVVVRDIDGDGRLDVMTGKYPLGDNTQRQTVWYGNTPTGWVEHVVSTTNFCHDLAFGDFDGDGHEDAVCADQFLYQVAWLHGPANPADPWPSTVIDAGPRPMGGAVADIDRDGRPDVVVGMAWYRLSGGTWTKHPYTTLQDTSDPRFNDYARVSVLDLNGDGRLDIFATLFTESSQGQVYAFLAPPDPTTTWTAVPIDPGPLFGVHSQAVGDFDGTSRPQIVVGETVIGGFGFGLDPKPHVYLYRLLGDASDPAAWERTVVDDTGTHEGNAIDFNGDGLPDLAGDEENTELLTPARNGRVSWWENVTDGGTEGTPPELVLQPDLDTYLTGPADPDNNYGAYTDSPTLAWVGTDQANAQRSLMRFTLYGTPEGSTVVACTLTVQTDAVQAPLPGHIWRVTQPGWTESGATWNRYDGVTAWATPGGDVDAASGIAFAPPTGPGSFAFPDLTPLCRDAIAARGGHLDLLIRQDQEAPGAAPHQWSFVMVGDGPNPEPRPSLVVTFSRSAGSGPPTTSTPTSTTSPTSTTLPACGATATFPSIECRLNSLATELESDVAASALRARLLAILQGRALGSVQQAERLTNSGGRSRVRVRLRHAERGLAEFAQRLNSARGRRAVAQSLGQTMTDEARAIRKAIHDLAGSLR